MTRSVALVKESSGEEVIRCRSEPGLKGKIVEEGQQSSEIVVSEIMVNTVVTAHHKQIGESFLI